MCIRDSLRACAAVGLVGTCQQTELPCETGNIASFYKLQWGRGARCTGLALWARRGVFPRAAVRRVWSGIGELRGRAGA
eukprot:1807328-Alexandrium_andersonii.AAC.1